MRATGSRLAGWAGAAALAGLLALACVPSASALELDKVGKFDSPVYVTSDPDDPERLFVVERAGTIALLDHGVDRDFLDLRATVHSVGGEQGMFSIAFDPGYATNHRFYVVYTTGPVPGAPGGGGDLRISEFTADASGNSAPASSERRLLTIDHARAVHHYGGQLQIGPDGYLYISSGDGSGGGDPLGNGQNLETLLGKILRIDPDPVPGSAPYSIPPDNPFAGATPGLDEIWSYGLRNPWRFSFDRLTGALVIGDVGQSNWEEVDYQPQASGGGRGTNFGWNDCEGNHAFPLASPDVACALAGHVNPAFEYPHNAPSGCAIVGGYIDRDPGTPNHAGRYWYSDNCDGTLRTLDPGDGSPGSGGGDRSEGISVLSTSSFGEDSCGRLYVADLPRDNVWRIEGATPTVCPGTEPPPDDGPCSPSTALGDSSSDRLRGGDAADRLTGNGGDDTLIGAGGPDCLAGGPGADVLTGGPGGDNLFAGDDADVVTGARGADHIWAADGGREEIACGAGEDVVRADKLDEVAGDCERVRRRHR